MLKKLLASSSGNKNGSSNIYMNGQEVYKIYRGQNLVYDVYNGRDFNYSYNYANQKFTFTGWKNTLNGEPNITDLIVPNDNAIVFDKNIITATDSIRNQIVNFSLPSEVGIINGDFSNAFSGSISLKSSDLSSSYVTNMSYTYYNCRNLTGNPVCGPNVTNMYNTYYCCQNLTDSPVCGDKVTNMSYTYYSCYNLTGSPVCGDNVTTMNSAYSYCFNLTGSPVCGNNVTTMSYTYSNCSNLTGSPVCGPNVTDMYYTYYKCTNLTGNPVCGPNVTDMSYTYYNCYNLTGSPACGDNVTNMYRTYYYCRNLTGSPVCGPNVTTMIFTYSGCSNLTGSPVCGDNVITIYGTYSNCYNLTGSPVCGDSVTNMAYTYYDCYNLIGSPVCGNNVTSMFQTYYNCTNLSSNGYFYSNKITNVCNCFYSRNTSNRLDLYVPENSTTLNTCLVTNSYSLVGKTVTWTNDMTNNSCYYNTYYNIYICPVDNVGQAYKENELLVAKYTAKSEITPLFNAEIVDTTIYYDGNLENKETIELGSTIYTKVTDDVNKYDIYGLKNSVIKFTSLGAYHMKYEDYSEDIDRYLFYNVFMLVALEDLVDFVFEEGATPVTVPKGIWMCHSWNSHGTLYYCEFLNYTKIILPQTEIEYEYISSQENDLYHITIYSENRSEIESVSFIGQSDLISVEKLNTSELTSIDYLFAGCKGLTSLESVNYEDWDLSNIKSSSHVFDGCENINSGENN